jgi:hypothetical protein
VLQNKYVILVALTCICPLPAWAKLTTPLTRPRGLELPASSSS